MKTSFRINKVPGNFHVSTHASHEQPVDTNMGHEIHDLTIGEHVEVYKQELTLWFLNLYSIFYSILAFEFDSRFVFYPA